MILRQGDIVLRSVSKTQGKEISTNGSYVVAFGEKTGHHHTLEGDFKLKEFAERRFLELEVEAILTHQEHDTITIPKGKYEIVIQREFDYELQQARTVQD